MIIIIITLTASFIIIIIAPEASIWTRHKAAHKMAEYVFVFFCFSVKIILGAATSTTCCSSCYAVFKTFRCHFHAAQKLKVLQTTRFHCSDRLLSQLTQFIRWRAPHIRHVIPPAFAKAAGWKSILLPILLASAALGTSCHPLIRSGAFLLNFSNLVILE